MYSAPSVVREHHEIGLPAGPLERCAHAVRARPGDVMAPFVLLDRPVVPDLRHGDHGHAAPAHLDHGGRVRLVERASGAGFLHARARQVVERLEEGAPAVVPRVIVRGRDHGDARLGQRVGAARRPREHETIARGLGLALLVAQLRLEIHEAEIGVTPERRHVAEGVVARVGEDRLAAFAARSSRLPPPRSRVASWGPLPAEGLGVDGGADAAGWALGT
jgi:hypothetical protein